MKQKEIAVITPWREQVWRMRAKLRASGFGGVDVGNVEVSRSSYNPLIAVDIDCNTRLMTRPTKEPSSR